MIRPASFTYNPQTAVNNAFQVAGNQQGAQEKAVQEFDAFVHVLNNNGVDVTVLEDTVDPHTPDSIFPNNWISFHRNTVCLYPMYAENRRLERSPAMISKIKSLFPVSRVEDFSTYEQQELFLEGTGSMVLDRDNNLAYACLSPRTDKTVLEDFCKRMDFEPVMFHAYGSNGTPVYHTNVLMCIADLYVVLCLEAVKDPVEVAMLKETVMRTRKKLITISLEQMNEFAGNMLQVENRSGEKLLVMSSRAYASLTPEQVAGLKSFNDIVHADLSTIETNGGGSARCMMAEVFV